MIHYDLPYNNLKMEQRIDRCQRLGQENDVLSLAFINQHNLADVRKLELVGKRMLVTGGVFGITEEVLGGFASDLRGDFEARTARLRHKTQVEADFQETLSRNEEQNCQAVAAAEDVLFTTFTRELAGRAADGRSQRTSVKRCWRYLSRISPRTAQTLIVGETGHQTAAGAASGPGKETGIQPGD